MGHEDEPTFFDRVETALREHYGDDNVTREEFLDERWRWCDLLVETDDEGTFIEPPRYAVEVEDTSEAAIESVGQTAVYAEGLDADPVLVVPEDHTEEPEMSDIEEQTEIRVVELPEFVDV